MIITNVTNNAAKRECGNFQMDDDDGEGLMLLPTKLDRVVVTDVVGNNVNFIYVLLFLALFSSSSLTPLTAARLYDFAFPP